MSKIHMKTERRDLSPYELDGTLGEAADKIAALIDEYGEDATITWFTAWDGPSEFTLAWQRPENERERKARLRERRRKIARRRREREMQREREIREYKRLAEKYGDI